MQRTALLAMLTGLSAWGCASTSLSLLGPRWVADYGTAEARTHETEQPLLIYYKDVEPGKADDVRKLLDESPVRERIDRFVRCVLFRSYEPDRRYVAQFGVERAPALILVHRDGTYHSLTGIMDAGVILDFLAQAQPPGARPDWDPLIPRQANYRWYDDLARAKERSQESQRPMFVVFYRRLTRDWASLRGLLETREVYSRVADMVQCRVGTWQLLSGRLESSFGELELPAVVVARPGGTFRVLELPTSAASVARFIDRSLEPEAALRAEPGTSSVGAGSPQ